MDSVPEQDKSAEPRDGDWCLIDLSDQPIEEPTRVAQALGMTFEQFMHVALEEKRARLRGDPELVRALEKVRGNSCLNSFNKEETCSGVARIPTHSQRRAMDWASGESEIGEVLLRVLGAHLRGFRLDAG